MHENEKIIQKFYTGFKNSDSNAMIDCYHSEIEFTDPVFPYLKGKSAKAMWAFLGQRRADPNDRTFDHIQADAHQGTAHWEAKYILPQTGRQVHNKIDAEFEFRDGKIIKHTDRFSFWRWSIMGFGPLGFILGWTPFFKAKVRKRLRIMLDEFITTHPEFK